MMSLLAYFDDKVIATQATLYNITFNMS